MQGAVLYGARDVRFEDRAEPAIVERTDAIISLSSTCICGSDLWPYRGLNPVNEPAPMGHEVTERGDEGVERISELTKGVGADSVLECVGTQESMQQAIRSTRPGGSIGYVGVPHGVMLDGTDLFYRHVHLHGGPAPVRRYLPELIGLVFRGAITPGKVFDLTLPLEQVAEGYRAMDERRAIKTLLQP